MKMRDLFINVVINGAGRGKGMVQPVEARGRKSLCALVDLEDYDAACRRYEELGIEIRYVNNRQPVVNVEAVREASKRWCRKRGRKQNTP